MISKATVAFIQSLKQKKYRQKYNKFLVEGEKIILEGLQEKFISFDSIYCVSEKEVLLSETDIKYNIIDAKTISKLSNLKSPPGILAIANIPSQPSIDSLEFNGVSLYLDNIRDPGNMGTIIRTADWFGVKNIIAAPESVEFYNPKVLQATMGSFARLNLINAEIEELPSDIPIYSSLLNGTKLSEFEKPESMILVIGSESHGVSQKIQKLSTEYLTISKSPYSRAESLNAGIATSIFLSHLTSS
ncbi:RNA methyltransferase [Portibacter lacus]|uniref:RNA methyltransferase n=1 Tax=Portibacter lacus TaxID=1099794 RepID=A0AA37WIR1_9BACT|nr:RNA methyltransferase [Portibacter lacus]GLR20160.1 RNA methyltransferase [Portibacter lacus]